MAANGGGCTLPIAELAITAGQIANDALVGTPSILGRFDPQPFCIGELGKRLGCELRRGHHAVPGSLRSPVGVVGSFAAANGLCRGRLGAEASPSTKIVSAIV